MECLTQSGENKMDKCINSLKDSLVARLEVPCIYRYKDSTTTVDAGTALGHVVRACLAKAPVTSNGGLKGVATFKGLVGFTELDGRRASSTYTLNSRLPDVSVMVGCMEMAQAVLLEGWKAVARDDA
jgi:hypothetical protein